MGIFDRFKKKDNQENINDTEFKASVTESDSKEMNAESNTLDSAEKYAAESDNTETNGKAEKISPQAVFYVEDSFDIKEDNGQQGAVVAGFVAKGSFRIGDRLYQVTPEGKILFECSVAGMEHPKDGNMTRTDEAVHNEESINASRYGFLIEGHTKQEFTMGNYLMKFTQSEDDIRNADIQIGVAGQAEPHEDSNPDAISEARKNEIGPIVLANSIDTDKLKDLSIQEMCFLLCVVQDFSARGMEINGEEKIKVLMPVLYDKLKNADELYITINEATNMPFINNGTVDVYSKKSFAEEAVKHYAQVYRSLKVINVPKNDTRLPENINLFAWFYYIGAENIMIDNGKYKVMVHRGDIVAPPDYSDITNPASVPVENPKLRYAMNDCLSEARWPVQYEGRDKVFAEKEKAMIDAFINAKYLVAVKFDGETEPSGENEVKLKKEAKIMVPHMTNTNNEQFQPAFTDWTEFEKVYDKNKWQAMVATVQDVMTFGKGIGIVINPLGENMILNEELKKEIAEKI